MEILSVLYPNLNRIRQKAFLFFRRGAQAVAAAIYMAKAGEYKEAIREYIEENYYDLDFTIDEIRPSYSFDVTCQGSVPQAIMCFLEVADFEDAIRNAVSLGGDGDTIAAMAGAIAEAYYGIPDDIRDEAMEYMDEDQKNWYFEYADELYLIIRTPRTLHGCSYLKITIMASVRQGWQRNSGYPVNTGYPLFFCRYEKQWIYSQLSGIMFSNQSYPIRSEIFSKNLKKVWKHWNNSALLMPYIVEG